MARKRQRQQGQRQQGRGEGAAPPPLIPEMFRASGRPPGALAGLALVDLPLKPRKAKEEEEAEEEGGQR